MAALTVRLSVLDVDWLRAQAERSGLSVNAVVEALIGAARERGWEVERQPRGRVSG